MNHPTIPRRKRTAFTLIELLVVVAIIVILAAMLLPIINNVGVNRTKKIAAAELEQLITAIDAYKSKLGYYPPANSSNTMVNPLYWELSGTIYSASSNVYTTVDGGAWISTNLLGPVFGIGGFANSSTTLKGNDDRPAAMSFLKNIRPNQIGTNGGVRVLVCSAGPVAWNYNSANPTNNSGSYDLWVDIVLQGQIKRFSNWSTQPQNIP